MNTEKTKRTLEAIDADVLIRIQELADLVREYAHITYGDKKLLELDEAEKADVSTIIGLIGTKIKFRFWEI